MRWIKTLIFVLVVTSFFGNLDKAEAQVAQQCCLKQTGYEYEGVEARNFTDLTGSAACRPLEPSGQCSSSVDRGEIQCSRGETSCRQEVTREVQVSCVDKAACRAYLQTQAVGGCAAKTGESECTGVPGCFWHKNKCYAVTDSSICSDLTVAECQGKTMCQVSTYGTGSEEKKACVSLTQSAIDAQYGKPAGASDGLDIIPDCAYSGNCRDVNDLVMVGVKGAKAVFKYIAAIALVMFVYGGFKIILSFGSADKVKSGRDVMIAAVIGMAIAFSAYLLVNSLLNALEVPAEFRIIK